MNSYRGVPATRNVLNKINIKDNEAKKKYMFILKR